jgi:hypothetical protein
MEWAQEAGDAALVSYVRVRKADQAAAARDAARTTGLAQTACSIGVGSPAAVKRSPCSS